MDQNWFSNDMGNNSKRNDIEESRKNDIPSSDPIQNEPRHDKTNKMACAPSEDSDQSWHPPSLIRVFAVREESFGP